MQLFEVTSNKCSRDEIGNLLDATVYVIADDESQAKEKAKEAFKQRIYDHDKDFDELEEMSEEDLELAYERDVSLKALHCGAKGLCSCYGLGEASGVVFHE